MNKSISKFLAASMAATMLLSTSAFAADVPLSAQAGSISNTITIKAPVYSIVVPEKLDLSLNPLMLGTNIVDQIYTAPFGIVNKSNVALDVKLTVAVKTGAAVVPYTAPTQTTEDLVLAASADVTSKDKKFSLYVAPAIKVTAGADPFDTIDVSAPAKTDFVEKTSYIGVGTTGAAINFALDASDRVTDSAYTGPLDADKGELMMTAFVLKGSLNKNCVWTDKDIVPAVSYQFGGVDKLSFANVITLAQYGEGKVTKAVSGTGSSVVATPRLRTKMVEDADPAVGTTDMVVELGSTLAQYAKDNGDATYAIGAITILKNGVADTLTLKDLAKVTFTIDTTTAGEEGLLGKMSIVADTLQAGATYTVTGFTVKGTKGTVATSFAAVTTVNYGTTIVVEA